MDIQAIQAAIHSRTFYGKFIKYLGVGIVATLVDWAIFYALIRYTSLFYLLALAASYLTSAVLSFFINRRFTFRNAYKMVHVQFASFITVALAGLCINELLVFGMANYLLGRSAPALVASRVIATLIVFIWNFLLNDRITFKIFR